MMTVNHMTEFVESIWKKQQKAGLETFDYENVLWGNEFPILLKSLKNLGIKEFTLSNKQGNMASILAELVELGCEFKGLVKIKNRNTISTSRFDDGMKDAFLLSVG